MGRGAKVPPGSVVDAHAMVASAGTVSAQHMRLTWARVERPCDGSSRGWLWPDRGNQLGTGYGIGCTETQRPSQAIRIGA
jgi:hypothetical protein